jgi:3-hydroxybutyryl-CoA dehydrogenase
MTTRATIAVVGLGTMGLGIAQVFAQAGFDVLATDANETARASATGRLSAILDERVKASKLSVEARNATLGHLTIFASLSDLAPCNMVIEAIVESVEAKQSLFAQIENIVSDDAVVCTNTSSLSVASIAAGLRNTARVLGLHFFNPAPAMKLVELVAHASTSATALRVARHFAEAAGKTVIACADRPGFIVNRCARPFYGEALALLEEGRSASEIDAAMLSVGYRLGPFSLIDLIGADINLAATKSLSAAMGNHPRYHVFDRLVKQVESGKLGRKSGAGFMCPATSAQTPKDAEAIALRIEATIANEAAELMREGGATMEGIDTALKLGLNFPRGPFECARAWGLPRIRRTLAQLENTAPPHLKGRYVISPALERMP